MRPVFFDTDIGTDVDDILALVLLASATNGKSYPETSLNLKIIDRLEIVTFAFQWAEVDGRSFACRSFISSVASQKIS